MAEKTALQVELLETRSDLDMVFGHVEVFCSPDLSETMRRKFICPTEAFPGYLAIAGLFRKRCFEQAGLFNEAVQIGPFIDWYMRAVESGLKAELSADRVAKRRIHGGNMSLQTQGAHQQYIQVLKAAMQRRRQIEV